MSVDKGMGALDGLYREVILDHHKSPRNYGCDTPGAIKVEGYNPLCGDRIEICLKVENGGLNSECKFQGEGCSICMASASMMTEEVFGKSLGDVQKTVTGFRALMKGEECPLLVEGDLESLVGVRNFPVRIKCALLPWTTLGEAVEKAQRDSQKDQQENS